MKNVKTSIKEHTSKKIKVLRKIYLGLMLFMFIIVLHDSFMHDLPFYYVLFFIGGLFIGRLVSTFSKFYIQEDEKIITFRSTPVGIIVIVLLLLIRFIVGKLILTQFNIVWTADALSLLFIGIYFAKVKNMFKQVDKQVYQKFFGG